MFFAAPHLAVDLLWSLRGMLITDKQEGDDHKCRDQTHTHTHHTTEVIRRKPRSLIKIRQTGLVEIKHYSNMRPGFL